MSVDEVLMWDDNGAPPIYERYLLLWDKKHVGVSGWDGFYFSRGVLKYKRMQWTAYSLLNERSALLENEILKRRVSDLESWSGQAHWLANKLMRK